MKRPGISDEWIRVINVNGESGLTFCGALEKQYNNISFRWNDETKRNYDREFNNIILPALRMHNEKTISDYSKEDYDEAIQLIREQGYLKNGIRYFYADSTIRHYEQLIYYVVFYASQAHYCDNVLWGTKYMIADVEVEKKEDVSVKLKKSLTVKQEKKLAQFFFEGYRLRGQHIGILLMYALGLRNGEACGLNYGDIRPLPEHPDCLCAWIYKSTIHSTTRLQSSGKTWNTGRLVPIPQKLLEVINARRNELEEYLKSNNIGDALVDQLPIVCKGGFDNYNKRCSAKDLTIASHEIFKEIGLSPIQLAYINNDLSDETLSEKVREKDATAYLLRRNFATHLQILGFSTSEIQYLIGHDVEDMYETRNEFMVSERLYSMAKRLELRPFLNDVEVSNNSHSNIPVDSYGRTRISISAQEPGDILRIKIKNRQIGKSVDVDCYYDKFENEYGRSINILRLYHEKYR